jgi:5-methylthioadenosine/S-adenosylhomocysteine deaminase
MFETVKLAALMHKQHRWDATAVPAQKALDMATVNAARVLGLAAGSIEEGKKADVICIDAAAPNLLPQHNIVSHLVYATHPGNVSDVIIDGVLKYHNRRFTSVEPELVSAEVERARRELVEP